MGRVGRALNEHGLPIVNPRRINTLKIAPRYTNIPDAVFTNFRLNPNLRHLDFLLYADILRRTRQKNDCYPSLRTLASELRSTTRLISESIERLTEADLLRTYRPNIPGPLHYQPMVRKYPPHLIATPYLNGGGHVSYEDTSETSEIHAHHVSYRDTEVLTNKKKSINPKICGPHPEEMWPMD